jgi:hypothetical protein
MNTSATEKICKISQLTSTKSGGRGELYNIVELEDFHGRIDDLCDGGNAVAVDW